MEGPFPDPIVHVRTRAYGYGIWDLGRILSVITWIDEVLTLREQMPLKPLRLVDLVRSLWRGAS